MYNLIIFILTFSCSVAYAQNFNKKFLENNWTTVSVNGNKAKVSDDAIVIGFSEEKLLLGNISTPYKLNGSNITFNAGPKTVVWEILKLTKKQLVIKEEEGRIIKMKKAG